LKFVRLGRRLLTTTEDDVPESNGEHAYPYTEVPTDETISQNHRNNQSDYTN
jgi:hypothetical protein